MEEQKADDAASLRKPAKRRWKAAVVVGAVIACAVFERTPYAPRQFHIVTILACGASVVYFARTPFQYRWGELLVLVAALSAQFGYALRLVERRVLSYDQASEISLIGLVATLFVWCGVVLGLKHFSVESSWARFACCLLGAGGMAGIVLGFIAQLE